jgi:hypothetical protein
LLSSSRTAGDEPPSDLAAQEAPLSVEEHFAGYFNELGFRIDVELQSPDAAEADGGTLMLTPMVLEIVAERV